MEVPAEPDGENLFRLKDAARICPLHINLLLDTASPDCRQIITDDGCPILHLIDDPEKGLVYEFKDGVEGGYALREHRSTETINPKHKYL